MRQSTMPMSASNNSPPRLSAIVPPRATRSNVFSATVVPLPVTPNV
jgi:hypothetical protein